MSVSYIDPALLRKLERFTLVSRKRVSDFVKGERRSSQKGSSVNFVDYRQYVPGDDIGQVDWNVYGRLDSLVVKMFEDEQNVAVHLLVDNSRSMDWGEPSKLQIALQLAATLGHVAVANLDRLYCSSFSDTVNGTFGPGVNRRDSFALFGFLEKVRPAGETDFEGVMRRYVTQYRQPGMTIIISDLLFRTGFERGLKHLLERRFEVVILHVLAPAEIHPVVGGDLKLVDRETGSSVNVTLNQRALNLYHQRYAAWTEAIEKFCAKHGVLYERIDSSSDIESLLLGTFRRRGLLA